MFQLCQVPGWLGILCLVAQYFPGRPGSCKDMFPLQAAVSPGKSKENTGSKQKRNGLGLMDYFPSLAAGKTGRDNGGFALSVNSQLQ